MRIVVRRNIKVNRNEWDELVIETEQYIYKLKKASVSVGELFYDGYQIESTEIFHNYLNGYLEISQAIIVTVESSVEFIPSLTEKFMPFIQELVSYLEKLQLLFSNERLVELADTMKYELPKHLEELSIAFKELYLV